MCCFFFSFQSCILFTLIHIPQTIPWKSCICRSLAREKADLTWKMALLWQRPSEGPFQPKRLWDEGTIPLEQGEAELKLHEAGHLAPLGAQRCQTGGTSPGQRPTIPFGAVDTQQQVKNNATPKGFSSEWPLLKMSAGRAWPGRGSEWTRRITNGASVQPHSQVSPLARSSVVKM